MPTSQPTAGTIRPRPALNATVPGRLDIHSPQVPYIDEIFRQPRRALEHRLTPSGEAPGIESSAGSRTEGRADELAARA